MNATVRYIDSHWVEIKIPKAVVILPMSQWTVGFKRGKSWKRRLQEQKRERQRNNE